MMTSRWGEPMAHSGSGQPFRRWGSPKPPAPQQEPTGQRTVYLPEPTYPPIPAARPARQQQSQQPASLIPRSGSLWEAQERQRAEKRQAERERVRSLQADPTFAEYFGIFVAQGLAEESDRATASAVWHRQTARRQRELLASARTCIGDNWRPGILAHMADFTRFGRYIKPSPQQQSSAMAELRQIEREIAQLSAYRPPTPMFSKGEAFERAALARLQFMRGKL